MRDIDPSYLEFLMVVLPLKPAKSHSNVADPTSNLQPLHAPLEVGDFVILRSLYFDLRVMVEEADGLEYLGTIVECPMEEYVGEGIEFGEEHIHGRRGPLTS
jgi:hypothetical protein